MGTGGPAQQLGYDFRDPSLLRQALTHRSFGATHNERLEFLGDSVLNCVIARRLYDDFSDLPEGDLSRLRAHLVNQQKLAALGREIGLGDAVLLGEGEVRSRGRERPSILANALEALLGAVFLDGGFDAAEAVVLRLYAGAFSNLDPQAMGKDPKTRLQEFLQGRRIPLPRYSVVIIRGEAHDQQFQVECLIPELKIRAVGEGASRRAAEQEAARHAYEIAAPGK
ncbi:MAG TPA: ribonuclease III [Burkholderiales bacterium]